MSKATLAKFLTMKRKVTAAKIHRTKKVVWVVCYKMEKASGRAKQDGHKEAGCRAQIQSSILDLLG